MILLRRLSLLTSVLVVPLLASCNTPGASVVQPTPGLPNSGNKMTVVPIKTEKPDTTQRLLGVWEWKFQVDIPKAHNYLTYTLELREKGKKPRSLNHAQIRTSQDWRQAEVTLALLPIEFERSKSKQLRTLFQVEGTSSLPTIENPFINCISVSHDEKASQLPDGSFLLLEGYFPKPPSEMKKLVEADMMLVLKMDSIEIKSDPLTP